MPAQAARRYSAPSTQHSALVFSWQSERVEHPALRRVLPEVAHGVGESESGRAVAGIELARDDGARPAAHAAEHRDVLLAVRAAVGDRLADDSGAGLELPEELARARVDGAEPALHRSIEDHVAGR